VSADHRVQAWFHSLRDAIGARNEPLYRERVVQFLITAEGVSFTQRNLDTPAARGVMEVVYRRLQPLLDLRSPDDLLDHLRDAASSGSGPDDGSMASTFTHYLRIGHKWSQICEIEPSYGVALALLLFEPLSALWDVEGGELASDLAMPAAPAARSIDRRVQFA
jgi:hypothetical protein